MTVRAARYIRASTKKQKDADTPATQRAALAALLARRGAVLVDEIEEILSGGTDSADRPGLQRLLALIRAKQIDELHVYKLDRLTRHDDPMERFKVYSACAEAGVVIVEADGSVTDPCDPSGMGELGYYIKTLGSAGERKKIKDRAKDAAARNKANGRSAGAIPRGIAYDKATGKWSTTADVADVVAAFKDIASGATVGSVAKKLGMCRAGLRKLLACPVYRGLTHHGVRVFPVDEQPVSDDVWLAVQAKLHQQSIDQSKVRELAQTRWASGLLCSGRQGHKLIGSVTTGRPDRYRCLCTYPAKKLPKCGVGYLRADLVHGWIDEALTKLTTDKANLRHVQQAAIPDATWEREELQRQIKNAETALRKSCRNNELGLKSDEAHVKDAAGYVSLRKVAQERLDALNAIKAPDLTTVTDWIDGFCWDSAWSPQVKRDWLRRYVADVVVRADGIAMIQLRLPGGATTRVTEVLPGVKIDEGTVGAVYVAG